LPELLVCSGVNGVHVSIIGTLVDDAVDDNWLGYQGAWCLEVPLQRE